MTDKNLDDSTRNATAQAARPSLRALSLIQPWAWAVLFGPKTVENRVWFTELVGPVWLASSAQVTRAYYNEAREIICRVTHGAVTVPHMDDLVYGAVLGRATVTDYILPGGYWCRTDTAAGLRRSAGGAREYETTGPKWGDALVKRGELARHPLHPHEWHFLDQYGYVLDERRALAKPVPCKGHQKAWTMKPELVELVERETLLDSITTRARATGTGGRS